MIDSASQFLLLFKIVEYLIFLFLMCGFFCCQGLLCVCCNFLRCIFEACTKNSCNVLNIWFLILFTNNEDFAFQLLTDLWLFLKFCSANVFFLSFFLTAAFYDCLFCFFFCVRYFYFLLFLRISVTFCAKVLFSSQNANPELELQIKKHDKCCNLQLKKTCSQCCSYEQ